MPASTASRETEGTDTAMDVVGGVGIDEGWLVVTLAAEGAAARAWCNKESRQVVGCWLLTLSPEGASMDKSQH